MILSISKPINFIVTEKNADRSTIRVCNNRLYPIVTNECADNKFKLKEFRHILFIFLTLF